MGVPTLVPAPTRIVAAGPNEVSTDTRNRYETAIVFHRVDAAYENHGKGWDFLFAPSYRYDLARALHHLGTAEIDLAAASATLGALVKYREDSERVRHALDQMLRA